MFEPTYLYKKGGAHQEIGGTFSFVFVDSEEKSKELLSSGWHASLDEAMGRVEAASVAPKPKKSTKKAEAEE